MKCTKETIMPAIQLVDAQVEQGTLRGQKVVPEDGLPYDAFRGVPYAEPPVGPLRFKAPRPPKPWNAIRKALEEASPAPQTKYLRSSIIENEDCLYLNVYTPQVPSTVNPVLRKGSPWPIMVWLHPGGYTSGSGSAQEYGPEPLVSKDVVVVTINSRLGALGFLSLESSAATGNYGLKDVVAALRWVKRNGKAFGGDTENITIFGTSSGAITVQLLQLSPMAKGLFHRAIAQSASCLCYLLISRNPRDRAIRLARGLGATDDDLKDDESILEFLRNKPTADILKGTKNLVTPEDIEARTTYMFTVVSEENLIPDDPYDEIFLPGLPIDLLKKGPITDVPLIMGMNDFEGLIVDLLFPIESGLTCTPDALERLNKNIESGLPKVLRDALPPQKRKEAGEQLRKVFFKGGVVNKMGYYQLMSDLIFTTSITQEVRILARLKSSPVYFYYFRVKGRVNRLSQAMLRYIAPHQLQGACHGDELSYLWNSQPPLPLIKRLEMSSLEGQTRERLVTLWTNFAKTGDPTPEGKTVEGVSWPKLPKDLGTSIVPYLDIEKKLTISETGFWQERTEFWDSLYAQIE